MLVENRSVLSSLSAGTRDNSLLTMTFQALRDVSLGRTSVVLLSIAGGRDRCWSVDYADCWTGFTIGAIPDELVARLHLVARTPQGHVIACRSIQGWRFLPGGTREPGETLHQLTARELMEEAGARTTGELALFSSHIADSLRDAPHRPHLPHPRSYWAYGVVDAEVVGAPTNLCAQDPLQADVVRLASAMGYL